MPEAPAGWRHLTGQWGAATSVSYGADKVLGCTSHGGGFALDLSNPFKAMQETVTLECTEARKEGKPVSRYLTKRNKKTVTERIEKKKYNPFLKRHTLHKEIK
jgi:large subunit ribosomal protein L33